MDSALVSLRKQLLAHGYAILPNTDKACRVPSWNKDFLVHEATRYGSLFKAVESWDRRFPKAQTTGARVEHGLLVIDGDVDDAELAQRLVTIIAKIAPDVIARAPARYGGGQHKVAWFCRFAGPAADMFGGKVTHSYSRPIELKAWRDSGKSIPAPVYHKVEIYGGKPGKNGVCNRQFGIYGPHTTGDDGVVAVSYAWADGPQLADTMITSLPPVTLDQVEQIRTEFERAADELGWEACSDEISDGGNTAIDVFDIDREKTKFEVLYHGECSYADLESLVDGEDLRCTANFIAGETSDSKDRCRVRWSPRFDCVMVKDGKTDARHYPSDLAPTQSNAIADALNELAALTSQPLPQLKRSSDLKLADFYAYLPTHQYIYRPSGRLWLLSVINSVLDGVTIGMEPKKKLKKGEAPEMVAVKIPASLWLDRNSPVMEMSWAPGLAELIRDMLPTEGGWVVEPGAATYNLYRPPRRRVGNPKNANRWVALVRRIYPDHADHIIAYCAHRIQKPSEKINHALVLTGSPGIGKDTLLAPLKHGIGSWNFKEISPQDVTNKYNDYMKSVVVRISETRDLGEANRYAFYETTKTMIAAPPDMVRVDVKYVPQHYIPNITAVIFTTNYPSDGLYLSADDRRHYVCGTEITSDKFAKDFFTEMWTWYATGGADDVVAYLETYDLTAAKFDAKAPPEKTAAFWRLVDAGRPAEESEFRDVLDKAGWPDALTIASVQKHIPYELNDWIKERKNARNVSRRLDDCGYVPFRNQDADDGRWRFGKGEKHVVYVNKELDMNERRNAVVKLRQTENKTVGEGPLAKAQEEIGKNEKGKIIPIKPENRS